MGKLRKKLFIWANLSLTLAGRIILLKHALHAVPTYHLMVLALYKTGFLQMEQVCRQFLWGNNKEGGLKKALIAWDIVTADKQDGGLGITTFEKQAMALKMRHVTKLIRSKSFEWTRLAKEIINRSARYGPRRKERRSWTVAELLLICPDLEIKRSATIRNLIHGWIAFAPSLLFNFTESTLPRHLSIEQAILLYQRDTKILEDQTSHLRRYLANRAIKSICDLPEEDQRWRDKRSIVDMIQTIRTEG